jgi:outer membrane immunogenic protein
MKYFAASLLIVMSLGTGLAHAQSTPTASRLAVDVAAGFTSIHANEGPGQCGCFFINGGSGEFSVTNSHDLSFVTNVGGGTTSNINNIGQNLTLYTVLEGARYTLGHGKLAPFGEAFVGISHTASNYVIYKNTTSAAAMTGGGLDLRLSSRFAIRAAEVDYLFTSSPNGQNNFQNQLRLTAGIVIHLNKGGR